MRTAKDFIGKEISVPNKYYNGRKNVGNFHQKVKVSKEMAHHIEQSLKNIDDEVEKKEKIIVAQVRGTSFITSGDSY